jgi:DNA adenine methylase
MRYMGGKARIAARLAPVVVERIKATGARVYWEPFLGGANMFTRIVPHVEVAIGSDVMPDLIMMWQAVQRGWLPPDAITREQYAALRPAPPSPLRAFAGFGCSFGGKWFGGYADSKTTARDAAVRQREASGALAREAPIMARAHVALLDYREARPRPGWLVYCDPPYAGTTTYSAADAWDADAFWKTAESWARSGCHVLVSEYAAPDGWRCVWEGTTRMVLSSASIRPTVVERLFELDG